MQDILNEKIEKAHFISIEWDVYENHNKNKTICKVRANTLEDVISFLQTNYKYEESWFITPDTYNW